MVEYVYDGAGRKQRVTYTTSKIGILVPMGSIVPPQAKDSPMTLTTDYCGNMIYENGSLKMLLIDDGYITFSGITPVYHYYLKDHLGNNRMVVRAGGTVEQTKSYYPFGGWFFGINYTDAQPYKYNGKELDHMHGLDCYDYGARHYDPSLARWMCMDPKAEKYYDVSPYAYCHNNPVNAVDPDGKDDYYNTNGKYLGTNNQKTDYIYIANRFTNDKNSGMIYIYDRTALSKADLSAEAWSNILTNTLSMMEEVDVKDLQGGAVSVLKMSLGNGNTIDGEAFNNPDNSYEEGENASQINNKITAKIGFANENMFATRSNIQNMLGVEEYIEHMKKGLSHLNKDGSANDKNNIKIFNDIMSHPTWLKTTLEYRKSIINYKNKLLGK